VGIYEMVEGLRQL